MDNLRRGILIFTVIVFSVVTVFGFILSLDYFKTSKSQIRDTGYNGTKYTEEEPPEASSQINDNLLIMIGDKSSKKAEILMIMNYNSTAKRISFTFVPQNMKYSVYTAKKAGEAGTVAQYFSKHGADQTTIMFASLLNIELGNYVFLDYNDFAEIIDRFTSKDKGVIFDMPVAVTDKDRGISISKGKQYFDGDKAVKLLKFSRMSSGEYDSELLKYYDGTEQKRINMVRSFVAEFLDQKILGKNANSYYKDSFYSLLSPVIEKCDNNISKTSFLENVSKTIKDINISNVFYYSLDCKIAPNDIDSVEYTDCILNMNNKSPDEYVVFSVQESENIIKSYYSKQN